MFGSVLQSCQLMECSSNVHAYSMEVAMCLVSGYFLLFSFFIFFFKISMEINKMHYFWFTFLDVTCACLWGLKKEGFFFFWLCDWNFHKSVINSKRWVSEQLTWANTREEEKSNFAKHVQQVRSRLASWNDESFFFFLIQFTNYGK